MLLYAGTQEQCVQVIVHLERIIHFRAHLLIKENHRRRIPKYGIKPSSNSFSISFDNFVVVFFNWHFNGKD